ncbi:MAG: SNF2 helicase associated domain-containing protein, partial [Leptospiraceae bacterium]|nr:SNF2 helicase associated domain-containing protein [Leptospiraceae bacterium]
EKYLVLIEKSVIGLFKKSLSVKLNLKPGYNIDWFSVEISIPGLTNEDEQYILSRLQAGEKFIKLQNGTWISLEHLGLEKAIAAIQNAGGKKQDALEYTGLDFQSALALALEWDIRSEEKINSFRDKLESIDTAASLPVYKRRLQGFQATLRDYQTEGMLFFMRLHDLSAGGILADDMGLGKTVQALAFLYILFKRDASLRFLAVVPLAAVSVWKNEAARFCSSLPVHLHHGANRDKDSHPPGLTITTYQTLLKDKKMFKERRYETVLCDEAQMIKNAQTGAAKSLRAVQSTSKFCLTGTPVENRVDDLWSLMDLVFPGYLGRIEDFTSRFAEHDLDDLTRLRKKIKPFLLRRTKSSVLKELPDLTENTILIEMTARQKALYAEENVRAKAAVQSGAKIFEILSWLTRLRRTACHPQIADAASIDPGLSGKLSYLQEILEELYVSSSGVLIFSQFT